MTNKTHTTHIIYISNMIVNFKAYKKPDKIYFPYI